MSLPDIIERCAQSIDPKHHSFGEIHGKEPGGSGNMDATVFGRRITFFSDACFASDAVLCVHHILQRYSAHAANQCPVIHSMGDEHTTRNPTL